MHSASWTGVAERAASAASVSLSQAPVVPIIPVPDNSAAFPGLYSAGLSATMIPTRPWLGVSPEPLYLSPFVYFLCVK